MQFYGPQKDARGLPPQSRGGGMMGMLGGMLGGLGAGGKNPMPEGSGVHNGMFGEQVKDFSDWNQPGRFGSGGFGQVGMSLSPYGRAPETSTDWVSKLRNPSWYQEARNPSWFRNLQRPSGRYFGQSSAQPSGSSIFSAGGPDYSAGFSPTYSPMTLSAY